MILCGESVGEIMAHQEKFHVARVEPVHGRNFEVFMVLRGLSTSSRLYRELEQLDAFSA